MWTSSNLIADEHHVRARKQIKMSNHRPIMLAMIAAIAFTCMIDVMVLNKSILVANGALQASSNTSSSTKTGTSTINQTTSAKQTSVSSEPAKAAKSPASTSSQIIDTQATDMSSMYVQIPIAETSDTSGADGVQQTVQSTDPEHSTEGSEGAKSGSTWTGPWPKKFQIGYIKQSDLHQVLIDSLKGDSFVSIGTGGSKVASPTAAPASTKSTKPAPTSDSASLMSSQQAKQPQWIQQQQSLQQQIPHIPRPNYRQHQANMMTHNQLLVSNRYQLQPQQQQFNFMLHNQQQQPLPRPFSRQIQQAPKMLPITGNAYGRNAKSIVMIQDPHQQPQQFQFPEVFPQVSMKNQPKYTIEQQPNPMALFMQQQYQQQLAINNRPQKSSEYHSSWRPVTSADEPVFGIPQQQQQVSGGEAQQSDGFDDGFNPPNKDAVSSNPMNRHPALDNYLKEEPGKTSQPRKSLAQDTKGATKLSDSATKSSPKSVAEPVASTKGGRDLSIMKNRPTNGTASTTTATPDTKSAANTTTSDERDLNSIGDNATTLSPTTTSATITSTADDGTETTEPDSEVADSETTDPSVNNPTTTSASTESAQTTSTTSTTASSIESANKSRTGSGHTPDETEVATLGGVQQAPTASLPSLTDDTTGSVSTTQQSTTSTVATSMREETTPRMGAEPASSSTTSATPTDTKGGEVEGIADSSDVSVSPASKSAETITDEALVAAAMQNAADIGKTKPLNQQQGGRQAGAQLQTKTSGNSLSRKNPRSPERLVQQEVQAGTMASGSNQIKGTSTRLVSGKSTGKQGSSQQQTSNRSAKQVGGSTKGKVAPGKSMKQAISSKQRASQKLASQKANKAAAKITRMTQPSERLQQQPQIVSMTPSQAQSTAQTLASLLLSRCMQSTNCAHLLDVCSTKQANIPISNSIETSDGGPTAGNGTNVVGWSMPVGLMSSSLIGLAQSLQADKALRLFPQWKDTAENIVDHETPAGYTLILPSNEAIDKLPANQIDALLADGDLLSRLIETHIIESAETIELTPMMTIGGQSGGGRQLGKPASQTRVIRGKGLQINQHRDRMVTINGKRLIYANQNAPAGGRIHVIDGMLEAQTAKPLDIMDTLKQCDKFDGFVTLAEGTGLTQILKQDGPLTVFVPSNEALRKIPDDELEVIKNNSTALKEFLMYHVVNGSYFSQDLRDGQQLSSILDMKPIQVGVRVDGCSRRLVEANTSPMRRPDIVAKNGVIHILDWYLTVRDNEWCDPIGRGAILTGPSSGAQPDAADVSVGSGTTSSSAPTAPASTSERLQQLAASSSEQQLSYATRIQLPANHKPADHMTGVAIHHHNHNQQPSMFAHEGAPASLGGDLAQNAASQQATSGYMEQGAGGNKRDIIVSATPIGLESLRIL